MPKNFKKATLLGKQIEAHLVAIDGLAWAIREDRALEGSDPGPYLNEYQQDAIHHAICTLSKVGVRELHDLLTELEVPV